MLEQPLGNIEGTCNYAGTASRKYKRYIRWNSLREILKVTMLEQPLGNIEGIYVGTASGK